MFKLSYHRIRAIGNRLILYILYSNVGTGSYCARLAIRTVGSCSVKKAYAAREFSLQKQKLFPAIFGKFLP